MIHRFLHKVEAEPVPLGIHTLGELPPLDAQRQALATVLESAFDASEARVLGKDTLARWAGALAEGREPDGAASAPLPPPLADKVKPRCPARAPGWPICANRRAASSMAW